MVESIKDFRYISTKNVPERILKMCKKENGCFYSSDKKKILLVDEEFINNLKKCLHNENKLRKNQNNLRMNSIKYWYKHVYGKKVEYYLKKSIYFKDCVETALEQLDDIYKDGYFNFENWIECLDSNIRLVALVTSWMDFTKEDFKDFSEEKMKEELNEMERKNYDIDIVKMIMNQ